MSLSGETGSALGLLNLAPIVMAASAADMVGALLFAAIGAFDMRGRRQRMVRTAHIAPRRRRLSLGDRHCGTTPFGPSPNRPWRALGARRPFGGGGQNKGRSEAETPPAIQAGKIGDSAVRSALPFEHFQHGKGVFGLTSLCASAGGSKATPGRADRGRSPATNSSSSGPARS